jgi:hypothetical protein
MYVGSNDVQFMDFIEWVVPISVCLTTGSTLANIEPKQLIGLFLSKQSDEEGTADSKLHSFYKAGLLTYKNFIAPNPTIIKFVGSFGDFFSERIRMRRPCLFLDIRAFPPSADTILKSVDAMYGKVVCQYFTQRGTFKFYEFKITSKDMELEKY